ncbi:uncharacterized protein N7458_006746 [Penicillium daleae]|uniref:Carboxylesterase type B domain-containing protein n=1 Tax=Penicillium daleae TaxID=63821 RepID=A0AAD6G1Z3_9EURO|nr:uncharacterized protein N7458_006746 [Penicillium daleae]KAJ5450297.1 hypothetical protein N7458_006746 [Penicillium daleae]
MAESSTRPSVSLPQGQVIGIQLNESFPLVVDAFLGVPYALPPLEKDGLGRHSSSQHLPKQLMRPNMARLLQARPCSPVDQNWNKKKTASLQTFSGQLE